VKTSEEGNRTDDGTLSGLKDMVWGKTRDPGGLGAELFQEDHDGDRCMMTRGHPGSPWNTTDLSTTTFSRRG
jgi:hypothetical protein